jgi:hypothetical protein
MSHKRRRIDPMEVRPPSLESALKKFISLFPLLWAACERFARCVEREKWLL